MPDYRDIIPARIQGRDDWIDLALCGQPEFSKLDWFPFFGRAARGRPPSNRDVRNEVVKLKAICAKCPAAEPCLEEALLTPRGADYGIRAGTDPNQRNSINRERRNRELLG